MLLRNIGGCLSRLGGAARPAVDRRREAGLRFNAIAARRAALAAHGAGHQPSAVATAQPAQATRPDAAAELPGGGARGRWRDVLSVARLAGRCREVPRR